MKLFGSAAILAGGKSRRMEGIDKQTVSIGDAPLGVRIISLLAVYFDEIIVVTTRPELYKKFDVHCIADLIPGKGPLSGIHAALTASASEWLYVTACDMPYFSASYAAFLRSKVEDSFLTNREAPAACITRFGCHIEPFHAFYSKPLLPIIENLLRDIYRYDRSPSVIDLIKRIPSFQIEENEARTFTPIGNSS